MKKNVMALSFVGLVAGQTNSHAANIQSSAIKPIGLVISKTSTDDEISQAIERLTVQAQQKEDNLTNLASAYITSKTPATVTTTANPNYVGYTVNNATINNGTININTNANTNRRSYNSTTTYTRDNTKNNINNAIGYRSNNNLNREINKGISYNDSIDSMNNKLVINRSVNTLPANQTNYNNGYRQNNTYRQNAYQQNGYRTSNQNRVNQITVSQAKIDQAMTNQARINQAMMNQESVKKAAVSKFTVSKKPVLLTNANIRQSQYRPQGARKLDRSTAPAIAAAVASRAAHSRSQGRCALYVRRALQAAGYEFTPNVSAYQYATNGTLAQAGFKKISNNSTPQVGDVVVYHRTAKNPHGHIQIYNGYQWVSDFRQDKMSPYSNPSSYTMWRDVRYLNNDASEKGLYLAMSE